MLTDDEIKQVRVEALREAARAQCNLCGQDLEVFPNTTLGSTRQFEHRLSNGRVNICWSEMIQRLINKEVEKGKEPNALPNT